MATLVQDSTASASTASGSAYNVLSSNVSVGHGVLVCVLPQDTSGTITSITSSIGTFTFIGRSVSSAHIEWWYCSSATGAAQAITVTTSSTNNWIAYAQEWSASFSAASAGTGASGNSKSPSASMTPTSGQLVLVGFGIATGVNPEASALPSSPWSNGTASTFWNQTSSGGAGGGGVAYQTASSGSTLSAYWTLVFTEPWQALGVALTFAPPPSLPSNVVRQVVNRAANWCKRESGLYAPERGFIVPRVA